MAPTLACLVLSGALLAGDPALEGSADSQPASATVEVAPAPPPETETEASVAETSAPRRALRKSFRLALQLGFGASPSSAGQFGGAAELDWYPLRFVRLQASLGAAVLPVARAGREVEFGALMILGGADGVLPFTWGEAFVGVQSGAAYSSIVPPSSAIFGSGCSNCIGLGGGEWGWLPMMRMRAGLELTLLRPFVVGFDVAYALFAPPFNEMHWAETHGRFGFAF